jgi:hypothetical protein
MRHSHFFLLAVSLIFSQAVFANCVSDAAKPEIEPRIQKVVADASQSASAKRIPVASFSTVACLILGRTSTGGRQLEKARPPSAEEIAEEKAKAQTDTDLQKNIRALSLQSDGKTSSLLLAALYDDDGYYLLRDLEVAKIRTAR